jgi:HEPN domain-containing protein
MLKALLFDLGATFHKTHELGALMDTLARSGAPLPGEFENLDVLNCLARFIGTTITMARSH